MTLTTGPREKVFSLWGMVHEVGPSGLSISIDHHRSALEAYWETTVHMIAKENELDVLSVPDEGRALDLPSWVPNFSISF